MAEFLNEFPFIVRRGRAESYPFDEWLDGRIVKVIAGVDFRCKPRSFKTHLYYRAKKCGKKVRMAMVGNDIVFQAY